MTETAAKSGSILVVDDNEDLLKAARIFLKRHFKIVEIEKNPEALPNLLKNSSYDVILLDMNFTKDVSSGKEGFYWLDRILQIDPSAVVVLITAYGDVQTAVNAIKAGATDFVLKPWDNDKLLGTIFSALKLRESKAAFDDLKVKHQTLQKELDEKYQDVIGRSPEMLKIFQTIEAVAETDANVLILGENGTGKEVIARAIHRRSKRAGEVFVNVDLGAITETLFESELFGHMKGAFTDAKDNRAGRFEAAHKGTLFLDEIGNLSLPLQAKLLSALQSRSVTRLGSNKPINVDIRLICATNMPVDEMVEEKDFRQDLLYRINTIELKLPPLRDRKDDIKLLADHYLKQYSGKYNKQIKTISEAAIKRMHHYQWPGNVRELQHSIERAVIMTQNDVLQPEDFFFGSKGGESKDGQLNLEELNIEDVEKLLIRKALQKHDGNITRAATELGLTRSSLYRRLEKYGL
ncbi:MAG: sigma-54 dependent transcriptional regulator [Bacteroidota bacterium]